MEILDKGYRTARINHVCDYCGEKITKGEKYLFLKIKGDNICEWKCHEMCDQIAQRLWEYINPHDDGLTENDFYDGCCAFCEEFICEHCHSFDGEHCMRHASFCLDKIGETLRTHDLIKVIPEEKGFAEWTLNAKE